MTYLSGHAQFVDDLRASPERYVEATAALDAARRTARLVYEDDELTPLSLSPLVLTQDLADEVRTCVHRIGRLLEAVADVYRSESALREYFPVYAHVEDLLKGSADGPGAGILRVDGIPTPDGYRIVEISTGAPAGVMRTGAELNLWSRWLSEASGCPQVDISDQPFASDPLLFAKFLVRDHETRRGRAPQRAAVVTFPDGSVNEVELILSGLESLGIPAHRSTTREISIDHGRGVVADRRGPFSLGYNKFDQVRFVNDTASRPYLEALAHDYLAAQPTLLAHCILDDKALLAFLTEDHCASYFQAEHVETVSRYIPWTRIARPGRTRTKDGTVADLYDYALADRSRLVLKPTDRARGLGVVIGQNESPEAWRTALENAFSERPHVIQEFVPPPQLELSNGPGARQSRLNYGLDGYSFGGAFAGFMCRASVDTVISVGGGGMRVPVLTAPGCGQHGPVTRNTRRM